MPARLLLLIGLAGAQAWGSPPPARVEVPSGTFRPLFGAEGQDLPVKAFRIDGTGVTNAEFAAFLRAEPRWKKKRVSPDLADAPYLSHWKNGKPRAAEARLPVTNVSWFAAAAYCERAGGRLPSTLEWEYAAAASRDVRDASRDLAFQEKILGWYSTRGQPGAAAASDEPNFYGVRGLHGRVWEWTSDFNAFFVAADNRQDGDQSRNFFCGAGSTAADNKDGYAAFMRYAFRSSLQANFSVNSLGFRCVYDHD